MGEIMMYNDQSVFRRMIAILLVVLGNILYALTVKLFLLPADLVTGGTTGIGLAVNQYTGISISTFVLIFNLAMLIVGLLIQIGRASCRERVS